MYIDRVFFLAFLFFGHFAMAQNDQLKEKKERIDSMMVKYYTNLDEANLETEVLHKLLTTKYTGNEYIELKVDVMLQRSMLYYYNGEHSKSLQVALQAMDNATDYDLPERAYRACNIIANLYERGKDYDKCRKYLEFANQIYTKNKLEHIYSLYCVSMASYLISVQDLESAKHFAFTGLRYAQKHRNEKQIRDAYSLLGEIFVGDNYKETVKYKSLASKKFLEVEDFTSAASQLTNAAETLLRHDQIEEAFKYSDSAFAVLKGTNSYINPDTYGIRSQLFEKVGKTDSAYYYFKKYYEIYVREQRKMENTKIKNISEQYQNDKKETTIKSKNQQMALTGSLLVVILIASVLLFLQNRKINFRNRIISKQVTELTRTLEQKQVLLSELQHRVKNNLQHVISILEIQRESVTFNNINELIRGTQNRIHSMALLHKKLNVSDNVNDVDLNRYIAELAEVVKESYESHNKKISLDIKCEIGNISIVKALPIGLMMVELVSNSMKHGFKKRNVGVISIRMRNNDVGKQLYYADNGDGFDFNKTTKKGLGQEIIKGLIDQLGGTIEATGKYGFELLVNFK